MGIGGQQIDHVERYVKEREDESCIGKYHPYITYSAEEAQSEGQELVDKIRGSSKLQSQWGVEGLDDL